MMKFRDAFAVKPGPAAHATIPQPGRHNCGALEFCQSLIPFWTEANFSNPKNRWASALFATPDSIIPANKGATIALPAYFAFIHQVLSGMITAMEARGLASDEIEGAADFDIFGSSMSCSP
mmetsp:Transcript_53215/g.72676  ORF Transcript_53215/g.72676 Transcript_53215/m.72676 type:complete len:121 (-) Transcript_53215:343-705(-)